ncbi:MAG: type VI secretion system tube protein Hcp [Phycisphaeraceae bacterium]|nr:type VI secretion system tube protein Hcp [Phycisphaeraceae bacterium]MCW5753850.1 type VI secretion system tube protein Hcp [Phycisphaeraceae bacterium]
MAFDAFLKIATIPGECQDDKHKDWIEILSYSHGVMQLATGSRSSGGAVSAQRCDHSNFSIVKALDKTSPKLNLACCNGEHINEIKLELCRATGDKQPYMEYKLSDCIVTSVRPGGSSAGGETLPLEEVSFTYGKITWTYTETDHKTGKPKGNVSTNWDLVSNKGG